MEEKESSTLSISPSSNSADTHSPPPVSTFVFSPRAPHLDNSNTNPTTIALQSGSGGGGEMLGKKKRGRPKKYGGDGNLRVLQPFKFQSQSQQHQQKLQQTSFTLTLPPSTSSYNINSSNYQIDFSSSAPPPPTSSKRGRGRRPGSGNWQVLASLGEVFANTAGADFTPHIVTVNAGEDVAGKILSFCQKGARGVCVLSANGSVTNVTIRQPSSSGGVLTYEGRFEILSLSGSFTVIETGGTKRQVGGLSISLAGSDGRVIGGAVAGLLLAASPIQTVVGSFMPNAYKAYKKKFVRENTMASVIPGAPDIGTTTGPLSQARPDHGSSAFSLPGQINLSSPVSDNEGPSPDINLSLPIKENVQGLF